MHEVCQEKVVKFWSILPRLAAFRFSFRGDRLLCAIWSKVGLCDQLFTTRL